MHGTHWIPQETFLKNLIEENFPQHPSNIFGIVFIRIETKCDRQYVERRNETKTTGVYNTNPHDLPGIIQLENLYIVLEELILKMVWRKIRDIQSRNCISGKFPESVDLPCWKINFRTELCSNSSHPTIAMSWIKEVEIVKSTEDLLTSQPIEGRDFPILKRLMRRSRLHCRRWSQVCISEGGSASKSNVLKHTTGLYEEGRLLAWSVTSFEQPVLVMQHKAYQIFSTYACRKITLMISKRWDQALLSKWDLCGERPGRFVQVKKTRFSSASHSIGFAFFCESALDSDSGLAEQGEFFVRRKRFLRSWNCEWRLWISKPILSVQKRNFSGDGKEFTNVFRAVTEAKSHFYWQFLGFGLHMYMSTIWDEWHCWKSGTQNEKKDVCFIVAITFWMKNGECHCYLQNVQDIVADGTNTFRTASRRNLWSSSNSVWCNGWISSNFFERPVKVWPIW